jgi:four helix bundle protein
MKYQEKGRTKYRVQSTEYKEIVLGTEYRVDRYVSAKTFEDLIVWQRAKELTKLIYSSTSNGSFQKDFGMKDQIQRASVSVMSNIAEGFGRGGNKEFVQFLFVAKGSLSEVQSLLPVAVDQNYMDKARFQVAYDKANEI